MAIRVQPSQQLLRVQREGRPTYTTWGGSPSPRGAVPGMKILDRLALVAQGLSSTRIPDGRKSSDYIQPSRLLRPEQLRRIYERNSDVRSAVDSIVRRVATWPWYVEPNPELGLVPGTRKHKKALALCQEVTRFFKAPNINGETWQEMWTKVGTDILVYDQGATEHVRKGRKLKEINPVRGSDIQILRNKHGVILGYTQDPTASIMPGYTAQVDLANTPKFPVENMTLFHLFSNTDSPYGFPILESLVHEVATLMNSAEHVNVNFDLDEVPLGMLMLTGTQGQASNEFVSDLKRLRGRDNKIRVLTSERADAHAEWIEFRRTPKDLSYAEVISETRRTVWRTFGVMPVEMGATEGMPRATAEVQLDASNSHLLGPIRLLIQDKVNLRFVRDLLGADAEMVRFVFDLTPDLSPAEKKAEMEGYTGYVDRGILTINEVREALGRAPYPGDLGSTPMVNGRRLADIVADTAPEPPPTDPSGGGPGDGPDPGNDGESTSPEEMEDEVDPGEDAPGEKDRESPGFLIRGLVEGYHPLGVCLHDECGQHEGRRPTHDRADLPSDWQPAGRFAERRTVPLPQLGELVSKYTETVTPLYSDTWDAVLTDIRAVYNPETYGPSQHARLSAMTSSALNRLVSRWDVATRGIYRDTAALAGDAAVRFTGDTSARRRAQIMGEAFGESAIGYLDTDGGLVETLRIRIQEILRAIDPGPQARAKLPESGASVALVLQAVSQVFSSNKHRVENWSGKLVDLAGEVLNSALVSTPTVAVTTDEGAVTTEKTDWWCEWVRVADSEICKVCNAEGAKGFRSVASLGSLRPGNGTDCRGNCRCVLTYWTYSEVKSGKAVSMN